MPKQVYMRRDWIKKFVVYMRNWSRHPTKWKRRLIDCSKRTRGWTNMRYRRRSWMKTYESWLLKHKTESVGVATMSATWKMISWDGTKARVIMHRDSGQSEQRKYWIRRTGRERRCSARLTCRIHRRLITGYYSDEYKYIHSIILTILSFHSFNARVLSIIRTMESQQRKRRLLRWLPQDSRQNELHWLNLEIAV